MESDPTYQEAMERFGSLFETVQKTGLREPAAMTLATVDATGQPSARIVLLRDVDERGFVFFTNSQSRKGDHLADNAHVGLCFHWDSLRVQVCVEGTASPVSAAESDIYWQRRPRGSQIGAWASLQSQPLSARALLEQRVAEFEQQFADGEVPRPDHWHGYRIDPVRIEFWEEGPSRLHTRTVYKLRDEGWTRFCLYP